MAKARFRKRELHKGDRVKFTLGARPVEGRVKEERGPIGINGRRLYLVEFGNGDGEPQPPSQIELPAEELEAIGGSAVAN